VLISQNNLAPQSERQAHRDLQVNLLTEQESTKTMELLLRIAPQLNVPLPAECESELATPRARLVHYEPPAIRRICWH